MLKVLPDKLLFVFVPFQSPKFRKKELRWTTRYKRLLEMCIVQYVQIKSVYIPTNKMSGFYGCKKCKACCHVLNIPLKDQKPTFMLFGGDDTHCFARRVAITKK